MVRKFLISTLNTSTDTLNRMSVEFITNMNNEATTKPKVLFEDDTPSDQHYSKVRPKLNIDLNLFIKNHRVFRSVTANVVFWPRKLRESNWIW